MPAPPNRRIVQGLLGQMASAKGGDLPVGLFGRQGSMSSYTPTVREKMAGLLAKGWFGDTREGYRKAGKVMDVADMTPVGLLTGMYDAGRAGGRGDYLGAGANLAMAVIPGFRGFHGSPTLKKGMKFDPKHPPRTDTGYLGTGLYTTPEEWLAKAYARPLKGGPMGDVSEFEMPGGNYKDFIYDENYIQTLEAEARRLGVTEKFNTPGWAEKFGEALKREGYIGARGLNTDGTVTETVLFDPAKAKAK